MYYVQSNSTLLTSLDLIELFFTACFRNQPATTPLPSKNFIVLISNDEDNGVYSRMEESETLHCHGNSPPSRSISFFISISRRDKRDSPGRKMWAHSREEIVFVSFDIRDTMNVPPYTADVLTTRCYLKKKFLSRVKTRWPRGNAFHAMKRSREEQRFGFRLSPKEKLSDTA